ncbi:MAG: DNA repair protein RecN [Rickettsiales bacterium]|nr:DNA repair protein RecN [Rickettsiales bacterium]
MLSTLTIHNILLVKDLTVTFYGGLCSLTGETGAGKSIILGSISFVLGYRASASVVREGAESGNVTAEFDIKDNVVVQEFLVENGLANNHQLILRRVMNHDGKSKSFINDTPVNVSTLKNLGQLLIEIHGQHDQKGLMNPTEHLSILDEFAQSASLKKKVASAYHHLKTTQEQLEQAVAQQHALKKEEEYLRFVFKELTELDPQEEEETQLADQRKTLMNQEKFVKTVQGAVSEVSGKNDPLAALRSASRVLLRSNIGNDDNFEAALEALERAELEVIEAVKAIESILDHQDECDMPLEHVEERLFALRAAARKYNCLPQELPKLILEIQDKITKIEHHDQDLITLEEKLNSARLQYVSSAKQLSKLRTTSAKRLSELVLAELVPLKMEKTHFIIEVSHLEESHWGEYGMDKVRFVASMNPGTPPGALNKIASGGELSRFMLAFKVALSEVKTFPTMIFDEVDTGIGGAVADAVGRRLELLASKRQILVVTHQPQVASRAHNHYKVYKYQQNSITYTTLTVLKDQERKEEIARMLSGELITDEARAAADSLISS